MVYRSHNRRFVRCWAIAVVCLLTLVTAESASAQQQIRSGEYNIKAAFIYNFTRFIEWPDSAFATPQSPFIVGVIGPDPFGPRLEAVMNGESVKGRPIRIKRFASLGQAEECHIVFVSGKARTDVKKLSEALRGKPILTVSDKPDFDQEGGMISLSMSENKIKLIINSTAAKASTLNISSKLLRLAEIKEELP